MSRLIRFLSRRRTGKGIKRGAQDSTDHHKKKKNILDCRVVLLDDSDVSIELPKSALGDALQQRVFYHLDLLETSYFGLQYTDAYNVNHWLDPTKKIKKQLAIGPPYTLRLRVKFFPTEPSVLKEELTKYQFFMQCKKDVLTGAMPVDDEALAVELAALALQSELGDYDEDEHTPAVVSEFRFVPNQSEEMEVAIFEKYKSIAGQKMTPDKAELQYLHKVKWLDMYGVDIHDVLGRDGLKYKLGLTPTGVLVFAGEERIGLFYWPRIVKFNFKKKRLILVVIEEETEGTQEPQEHTFVFTSENSKACKHVWKCAIEHHTFFRVVVQPVTERHGRQGFIRLGSRFRYSGRTQFEQLNRSNARRSVTFERQPSKRFSRRASLDAKELKNRRRRPPPGLSAEVIANSYATAVPSHSPSGGGAKVDSPHNGSPGSPMERLDNLIASGDRNGTLNSRTGRSDRETTPTGASGGGTLNKNRSILDHAEAAQAKLKGLSDTPEAPPRPNKDVNLYQNNQVKVLSKEKVQIEIKSNNLKSRSGDERMSGKRTNIDSLNRPPQRQFSTEPLAARVPNKPARHHSVPQPAKQYGSAVMQEDDNVSTESEGESSDEREVFTDKTHLVKTPSRSSMGVHSPISPMSNHSQFVNGSRSRGSGSSSSNRLLSSPINNASASLSTNYHRDEQMDSPEAKGSAENKPVKLEKLASEDDCVPLLGSPGSSLALSEAVPCVTTPSTGEDSSFDAQRKPASRPMSLSNRTVDVKPKMAPPKPAPRKVEKRVCITTEL